MTRPTIFTIGHSTRALPEFVAMLQPRDIRLLVDIRTVPRSRHNPQFNSDALARDLPEKGIAYKRAPGLGGFRRPRPDSINTGWRNSAFRGFADYMQTAGFEASLDVLIREADEARAAVMCAEAVPWRCHRNLIADALVVRGFDVSHIMGPDSVRKHELSPLARVDGLKISYPQSS